jgi:secreted trypsin-like serine protease
MRGFRQFSRITGGLFVGASLMACTPGFQDETAPAEKNNTAIIGGTEVSKDSALAQSVALLFNRMTTEVCTVSILNNQFALTAAHCVTGANSKDLYIIFDMKLKDTSPFRRVVATKSSNGYNPKAINREYNTEDLALVRFAGGVPAGYTSAKFLPKPGLLKDGATVTAVGFGVTDDQTRVGTGTLRMANLKILRDDFSETEMTLNQSAGSGVCHGDSGGPVYMQLDGKYYLWGVVSRSLSPDNCSEAAIITNSLLFLSWVKDQVMSMGRQNMIIPPDDGPPFAKDELDF